MTEVQRKKVNERKCADHLLKFKDAVRVCLGILNKHDIEVGSDELEHICVQFENECYLGSNNWLGASR